MLIFALFMPSTKTVTTGKSETYIYMYTLFIIYIQATDIPNSNNHKLTGIIILSG